MLMLAPTPSGAPTIGQLFACVKYAALGVFPLAGAAAAHRRLEEAGQFGKIVLGIE
jgi:hypothetical protein